MNIPEQDVKRFYVCQDRLSCTGSYSWDYLRRTKKSREGQGTGNLVNDLRRRLESRGIEAEVKPIICYGWYGRSPVVLVDGKLEPDVYWNKLDDLIDRNQ